MGIEGTLFRDFVNDDLIALQIHSVGMSIETRVSGETVLKQHYGRFDWIAFRSL